MSYARTRSPGLHGDPPAAVEAGGVPDKEKLARIAVERTRMPMVITDHQQADCPIVLANKAFLELTGYSEHEVIGRNCRFLQGAGTSAAVIDSIREAVAAERDLEVEVLNYRKDGSAFWNQLNLSPVHDDAGQLLYYFGSQIDVTDLRRVRELEASEHRLLMEVDHRAQNVLAVVNGIVEFSQREDPTLYAAAVRNRVMALSQAHTLLAQGGWKDVSLESIVRQQTEHLDAGRMCLTGPEVLVAPICVQPLSLAVHELAVNAVTHGVLKRAEGELRVSWDTGKDRGGFELLWEEPGVSAPILGMRRRGGSKMVAALIEWQLGGRLEQNWGEQGLTIRMEVPGVADEPRPDIP